eukprot:SAG31_NODE_809_length_11922_cov_15.915504_5_plen_192_part_00
MKEEFNRARLSDCQFIVADDAPDGGGDTPIYCHRLVLAVSNTEYFKHLLIGPLAEQKPLPLMIELPSWAGRHAAALLLGHLYGHPLNGNGEAALEPTEAASIESVLQLLRLSDMMQLQHAKQWCEVWLANSSIMDLWNTVVLLEHAYTCQADQLIALAVFNIVKMFDFVIKTEEWQALDPEIQNIVYTHKS